MPTAIRANTASPWDAVRTARPVLGLLLAAIVARSSVARSASLKTASAVILVLPTADLARVAHRTACARPEALEAEVAAAVEAHSATTDMSNAVLVAYLQVPLAAPARNPIASPAIPVTTMGLALEDPAVVVVVVVAAAAAVEVQAATLDMSHVVLVACLLVAFVAVIGELIAYQAIPVTMMGLAPEDLVVEEEEVAAVEVGVGVVAEAAAASVTTTMTISQLLACLL